MGKNSLQKTQQAVLFFYIDEKHIKSLIFASLRSRSTMDSIRVSEAPDPGSIPGETTDKKEAV